MTYLTALTIPLTLASLAGVILNIKKNRACFWVWLITNFTWAVIDLWMGIYLQAFLFFVYFLLAIWGLLEWKRGKK